MHFSTLAYATLATTAVIAQKPPCHGKQSDMASHGPPSQYSGWNSASPTGDSTTPTDTNQSIPTSMPTSPDSTDDSSNPPVDSSSSDNSSDSSKTDDDMSDSLTSNSDSPANDDDSSNSDNDGWTTLSGPDQSGPTDAPSSSSSHAPKKSSSSSKAPSSSKTSSSPKSSKTSSSDNRNSSQRNLTPYQQQVLDAHNTARAKYGGGAKPMTYDLELEKVAKDWVSQCKFEHSKAGENLSAGTDQTVTQAIESWVNEVKDFKKDEYSHFTQVVWKSTTKVGCATQACDLSSTTDGGGFQDAQYTVCEYLEVGNVIGEFDKEVAMNTQV